MLLLLFLFLRLLTHYPFAKPLDRIDKTILYYISNLTFNPRISMIIILLSRRLDRIFISIFYTCLLVFWSLSSIIIILFGLGLLVKFNSKFGIRNRIRFNILSIAKFTELRRKNALTRQNVLPKTMSEIDNNRSDISVGKVVNSQNKKKKKHTFSKPLCSSLHLQSKKTILIEYITSLCFKFRHISSH